MPIVDSSALTTWVALWQYDSLTCEGAHFVGSYMNNGGNEQRKMGRQTNINLKLLFRGLWKHVWHSVLPLIRCLIILFSHPELPAGFCQIFDVWVRHIIEMSKLLTFNEESQTSVLRSLRKVQTQSLDGLHVGGGPLTYLSARWKPRGILLLRWHGGSGITQIRQARRARAAARRR